MEVVSCCCWISVEFDLEFVCAEIDYIRLCLSFCAQDISSGIRSIKLIVINLPYVEFLLQMIIYGHMCSIDYFRL